MFLIEYQLTAQQERQRNFDDLQREISGITAGKTPKFLTRAEIEKIRQRLRKGETDDEHEYRLKCIAVIRDQMRHYFEAIDRALVQNAERIRLANEHLKAIQAAAMRDKEGRAVYRTEDRKHAFYEDGTQLTQDEMAAIHWSPTAPTWEQRKQAGDRLADALKTQDEISSYKERVQYYDVFCDDLSPDELRDIERDMLAMPPSVRDWFGGPANPTSQWGEPDSRELNFKPR